MIQPTILVYGRDSALLSTRRMVLASAGYAVTEARDLCEMKRILMARRVDLLILCHSLSNADCQEVYDELHASPRPPTLILTAVSDGCPAASLGEVFDAREGPAKLIATVQRLLSPKTQRMGRDSRSLQPTDRIKTQSLPASIAPLLRRVSTGEDAC